MTTDAAGVSERERLARALHDASPLGDWLHLADQILAAGFGDVAQAKAEALEEAAGYVNRECFYSLTRPEVATMLTSHAAEYRAIDANEATS